MSKAAAPPPEARPGLRGHLDLLCALDSRGVSSLQRQSFRAPFHISKPHLDGRVLVVNVANPTAGFLEGDRVECTVRVATGASLLLTTPAANRAHRMRSGWAEAVQRFDVERGGWLEVWPELFIPQAGTRFRQRTTLKVEEGGEAIFVETLAPGRVASGESFAYEALEWETDVFFCETAAARERYRLTPAGEAVRALRAQFPDAYYGSVFVMTSRLDDNAPCWKHLHGLQADDLWIGSGRLVAGGLIVKLLAGSSIRLRAALAEIRVALHGALGRQPPELRRVAGVG